MNIKIKNICTVNNVFTIVRSQNVELILRFSKSLSSSLVLTSLTFD